MLKNLTLLYADDEPVNLRVVRDLLGSCGFAVVIVPSGAEAVEAAAVQAFDLILLDIHMPGMGGPATLAALRKQAGLNCATPIVALTADVSRSEMQYRELGFAGLISKPVSLKSLLAGVLAALSPAIVRPPIQRTA